MGSSKIQSLRDLIPRRFSSRTSLSTMGHIPTENESRKFLEMMIWCHHLRLHQKSFSKSSSGHSRKAMRHVTDMNWNAASLRFARLTWCCGAWTKASMIQSENCSRNESCSISSETNVTEGCTFDIVLAHPICQSTVITLAKAEVMHPMHLGSLRRPCNALRPLQRVELIAQSQE